MIDKESEIDWEQQEARYKEERALACGESERRRVGVSADRKERRNSDRWTAEGN